MFRIAVAVLLVAASQPSATIVAVAPNPFEHGDRGEYVVIEVPRETDLSNLTLSDGTTTARFENGTATGRFAVTTDPDAVRNRTDLPVVELRDHVKLANDGDTIRLQHDSETVDEVTYRRAPEGEHLVRTDDGWEWRQPGVTDLAVATFGTAEARLFVLPDAPNEAVAALESARDRVLLAGYTFGSRRVVEALCDAQGRGVTVRILLERDPVGGFTDRSADLLDHLEECGVDATLLGGSRSRYAYHHAKYAVIDDRALVLTENWKPAGTGGRSSRGWGVLVDDEGVARTLVELFEADARGRDSVDWSSAGDRLETVAGDPPPDEEFPTRFEPRGDPVDRVEVVVAPDNAEDRFVDLLDRADDSILVQQLAIGSTGQPFVRALIRAAERGVDVRVLLSAAWYVRDENAALASWLNDRTARDDLPMEARLSEPRSRYGKIHAKGVVVDEEVAVVGSVNWNNASVRDNREVAVIVHGDEAGRYYARVFRADWRGGTWRLPLGVGAACGLVALASAAFARLVRFEDQ